MKGLELSRTYYERCAKEEIARQFGAYEDRIASGLVGFGSECFGYDDEISVDHDFGPRFFLFLTDEDEAEIGFELARFYRALPNEFNGIQLAAESRFGAVGGGVMKIGDFYRQFTGSEGVPKTWEQWLSIPEASLACAVNGEVFCDPLGTFSAIRETLQRGYPEDCRRKKLAAAAIMMAQSGQYNYSRCRRHGEHGAAQLALAEFVQAASSAIFLLNRRYKPYYKWVFRSMEKLPVLAEQKQELEALLMSYGEDDLSENIERICTAIVGEIKWQGLSDGNWTYLEPHAIAIRNSIENREIRSLHIMDGYSS